MGGIAERRLEGVSMSGCAVECLLSQALPIRQNSVSLASLPSCGRVVTSDDTPAAGRALRTAPTGVRPWTKRRWRKCQHAVKGAISGIQIGLAVRGF
jgi:hypothetical protein